MVQLLGDWNVHWGRRLSRMGYTTWSQDFQEINRKIKLEPGPGWPREAFRAPSIFDLGTLFGLMTTFSWLSCGPSSLAFHFILTFSGRHGSHSPSLPEWAQNTFGCDLFSTSVASGKCTGVKSLLSGAFPLYSSILWRKSHLCMTYGFSDGSEVDSHLPRKRQKWSSEFPQLGLGWRRGSCISGITEMPRAWVFPGNMDSCKE